jgi:hypothetical protein
MNFHGVYNFFSLIVADGSDLVNDENFNRDQRGAMIVSVALRAIGSLVAIRAVRDLLRGFLAFRVGLIISGTIFSAVAHDAIVIGINMRGVVRPGPRGLFRVPIVVFRNLFGGAGEINWRELLDRTLLSKIIRV